MTITTFRKAQKILREDREVEKGLKALSSGNLLISGEVWNYDEDKYEIQQIEIPLPRGEVTKIENALIRSLRDERKKLKTKLAEI